MKLWSRQRGLSRVSAAYPPSFYMYLKDPSVHWEMIEGLESRYRIEESSFNTIFGSYQGQRIYASRKVAERIEKQTCCAVNFTPWMSAKDQPYLADLD